MDGVTDLTRPADAQPLSEDGGLHVLVLEEGQGDLPAKYSRCLGAGQRVRVGLAASVLQFCCQSCRRRRAPPPSDYRHPLTTPPPAAHLLPVHYVGRLAESGQVFMDTRKESQGEEPAVLVAGRGATGWQQGEEAGGRVAGCNREAAAPPVFALLLLSVANALVCKNTAPSPVPFHSGTPRCVRPGPSPPHRLPPARAGPAHGGVAPEVRRPRPHLGGTSVRVRRKRLLLLPHRAACRAPSVSGG